MLNETNIECFLVLSRTLSFTETARQVHLTQQAVSKNIANLENSLGLSLLARSAKGISLTPKGAECRELFSRLSQEFNEKITALRARCGQEGALLRVGWQNYLELGTGVLNANAALLEAFPGSRILAVRYSPGELNHRFSDGNLDVIVICKRYFTGDADVSGSELFRVPSTLMVSPDNPNVSEDATYMDFRSEPYIVDRFFDENATDFNRRVKDEIDMCSLRPANVIIMPNRDSAYSAAELGNGVLLGSEISQTARGSRLLRYRTGTLETISCFWRGGEGSLAASYAGFLADAYGRASEE